ncbi:response regulator transcription factor [Romboutsia sedimentorum]|uniref:Stage 0 sporulation protein A homolog n=1 Tax=Romboutsia sedimentorum TaxID=1368474 RepID=A0ABT7E7Q5_9FIRM|nr:response regulator transcription factor [Romboutsia sedimentorum]MDK2562966.1 response regulator transcription factor [Romboutsia sedimentorum]
MGILIVSDSFIVRDALYYMFNKKYGMETKILASNFLDLEKNLKKIEISKVNCMILDIEKENMKYIEFMKDDICENKIVVLDLHRSKEVCATSIKQGVDGYILNIAEKEEFMDKVNSIIEKGKKFYDIDLLQNILQDEYVECETLTNRENEILEEVGKGYSNKEIAKHLYITEYTVKKHISSILLKLNLRSRKNIIIYFKEKYSEKCANL